MSPKQWLALFCFYLTYLFFGASIFYLIERVLEEENRASDLKDRIAINGNETLPINSFHFHSIWKRNCENVFSDDESFNSHKFFYRHRLINNNAFRICRVFFRESVQTFAYVYVYHSQGDRSFINSLYCKRADKQKSLAQLKHLQRSSYKYVIRFDGLTTLVVVSTKKRWKFINL